ncbi:MAG: endonuclease III [Bdellovibrionales bacterium]
MTVKNKSKKLPSLARKKNPKETFEQKKKRTDKIVHELSHEYADAKCSLDYENPLQLLIATILSAQCTDARVNKTTPALFARYPNAKAFANADITELETLVRSTGFYKNKAKNIKACCQELVTKYKSQVPKTMEELSALAGVGRKTANVVLGNAYGIPGMVVDTHVTRLSNRLGLVKGQSAVQIEKELEPLIEREHWVNFSHWLISHGRAICTARKPLCDECFLNKLCPKLI